MKGFEITRLFVIVCELCNENILERGDESEVRSLHSAEEYARGHRQQHIEDGTWPKGWPR